MSNEYLDIAMKKVIKQEVNAVLDKIREEIEPKCDRINSLASTLCYPAHREIQEILCDILELLHTESEE